VCDLLGQGGAILHVRDGVVAVLRDALREPLGGMEMTIRFKRTLSIRCGARKMPSSPRSNENCSMRMSGGASGVAQ